MSTFLILDLQTNIMDAIIVLAMTTCIVWQQRRFIMSNFKNKINTITNLLAIKNAKLSEFSGIDPSTISRYKNGTRKPYKNSKEITKLANTIIHLSENKQDILLNFLDCKNPKNLEALLCQYLNTDDLKIKKFETKKKRKTILLKLGPKLDSAMQLLNISNLELAQAIKIDTSLISRYRNKLRFLNANAQIIDDIAAFLVSRAKETKRAHDLYRLLKTTDKFSEKILVAQVIRWLNSNEDSINDSHIEKFLRSISEYDYSQTVSCKIKQIKNCEHYWGVDGLITAFNNFLYLSSKSIKPTDIFIYTNYSQEQLLSNQDFKQNSLNMMSCLLSKGNNITIYQDTNNSIEEIINNIGIWLPLFFTTKCKYKYILKVSNPKFVQTVALAQNICVLTSVGVMHAEKYIEHNLSTDAQKIENYNYQFEELKKLSFPLVETYDYSSKEDYITKYKYFHNAPGDIIDYVSAPLLGTMPLDLLKKILSRYDIPKYKYKRILNFHNLKSQTLIKALTNNTITEYISIDNPAPTVNMSGTFLNIDIKYTTEEYKQHLNYLKQLSKLNKNYKFNLIKSLPFSNIRLLIKKGIGTLIIRNDGNFKIVFVLQHSILNEAFESYVSSFINKK